MKHVVVIGNGMVGGRFAQELAGRDVGGGYAVTVLGAEEHEPYNRVLLTDLVAGKAAAASLRLPDPPAGSAVRVLRGAVAVAIDRSRGAVTTADGGEHPYDVLVLATGARARVLPLPGLDGAALPAGVHVLRSLDDARGIVAGTLNARRAVVVGGGVLGLETATGLLRRGVPTTVVHAAPGLMERQLDEAASAVVVAALTAAGIECVLGGTTTAVLQDAGRLQGLVVGEDRVLPCDLLVLCCGTVPDTALAQAAGLPWGRGITVGPDLASTADPDVFAIGDCADPPEGGTGLVAQGWEQARRLAHALVHGPDGAMGGPAAAPPAPDVVRVKGVGLDIVAMGIPGARAAARPDHRVLRLSDPGGGRHVELVVRAGRLVGAVAVGAGAVAADLVAAYTRSSPTPLDPAAMLLRATALGVAPAALSPVSMPDRATVCRCNGVTKGDLMAGWGAGCRTRSEMAARTRATTGCGGCGDAVDGILDWLRASDPEPGAASSAQPSQSGREVKLTAAKPGEPRLETTAS